MTGFDIKKGALYCDECKVSDIVKDVGTPAYIYSSEEITGQLQKLKNSFSDYPTEICYSIKSNSNVNIISLLQKEGAGVDIVSGGELFRALKAGVLPNKIVYSGVGKTDEEIKYAIETNIKFFNVESIPELKRISKIATSINKTAKFSIRINPDIDAKTHQFTTTAKKENKFGLPISEALSYYLMAKELPNLEAVGIDVHLGSPILTLDPYTKALEVLSKTVTELRNNGVNLKTLDIGGGLGIVYKDEVPFTADAFAKAIIPYVKDMGLNLVIEPGRFIVGNAGILVTDVTYVKKTDTKTFVIVDAGMNDLIRPPLYGGYHKIVAIENPNRKKIIADVVGPICESADFFAKKREIPDVTEGEKIAIMSSGAYGFSMSSNYNSRPRPCEILVDKDTYRIIRKRESYESLINGEI